MFLVSINIPIFPFSLCKIFLQLLAFVWLKRNRWERR